MEEVSAPALFRASSLKLARASKHIGEMEIIANAFIASNPVKIFWKAPPPPDPNSTLEFGMMIPAAPIEMSAVLGDVVHNIRAALDLLACELCRINGQSDENVYFPFCEDANYLDEMIKRRNFDRAGAAAVNFLKELKPYKGGHEFLRAIHDLDIQDKHRILLISSVGVGGPIFKIRDEQGRLLTDEAGKPRMEVEGDPNAPSTIEFTFPDGCPLFGRELIQTLKDVVQSTLGIIGDFKTLCTPAG